jgi:WD40 repeat protein
MLFDSVTGQIESILGLHERSQDIGAIAFSPDGSILASAGGDGVIFWNMNDNAPIPTNLPSVGAVNTIEFSIDGSMLGYGDTEGNVHIWNVETNRVAKVAELGSWITAVKFSPDNTKLAVTTSDGTIVVWDIIDESVESETHFGPGYSVNDANFSPDSNLLVSGGDDRVIRLWDVQSSTELTTFQGDSTVETVIFSPTDAPLIASGNSDGTVTLWDVSANERVSEFGNSRVLDQSIVFDSTGERLVSLNDGVTVWNVEDETELFNIDIDYEWPINTVALNPSDDIIAFATIGDGVIYLWEGMSIENEPIVLGVHGSPVSAIAFNSEGNLLVTAGQNILKLWNLETHQLIYTNNSNSGEIADVDFNSDGSLLIFSKGSSFRILNVQDRTERVMLEANYGGIRSVDFSSDGTLIATAGYDGTIQLWGIASTCED